MIPLTLIPDLEVRGFREGTYGVTEYQGEIIVGGMPKATASGKPSVMIALEDPETGGYLVAETTLQLFLTAADALKAKYGDPQEQ